MATAGQPTRGWRWADALVLSGLLTIVTATVSSGSPEWWPFTGQAFSDYVARTCITALIAAPVYVVWLRVTRSWRDGA